MSHEVLPRLPEPRLLAALDLLAERAPEALLGRALDLAAGPGRHALLLAGRGMAVDAWDRDAGALARLESEARGHDLTIVIRNVDLEAPGFTLPPATWSLIVVLNYLHRTLCPAIAQALLPGGALYYETFTLEQPRFGKPVNPDFLLAPGELRRLFPNLEELSYAEGVVAGRSGPAAKATRVARRAQ